jgi:hypothetical protein
MNPTEIADALEALGNKGFDPVEFPYDFAAATGNAPATVSKLRPGVRTLNKSKLAGAVLMNRKFYFIAAERGAMNAAIDLLREDKKTTTHRPAILLSTDGEDLVAEHPQSGEVLRCRFADLHKHFGFFLPAAGMGRYRVAEENPVDVKATGRLAKLYDALLRANPEWGGAERRHDLNQFMTRIIFCLFAEDVGIFPKNQLSRLVVNHAGEKGAEAHITLKQAFSAMNLPRDERKQLPAWTNELEYVNGGLFAGRIDSPKFDALAWGYFRDAARLDWQQINPDIFGSMIQSVADPEMRGELGMHYTSVPNILKVLGPLFLDSIDEEINRAWDKLASLKRVLPRLGRIRVFDPACGSGNFLVIAYRELRAREMKVLKRIGELSGNGQVEIWSSISLANFHGIEITDFGAETAKLALFIAEYQANAAMAELFGAAADVLPLRDGGHIVCGNALRMDWDTICPPPKDDEEVYIAGNPPFLGSTYQSKSQKADLAFVFSQSVKNYAAFDFVAAWFYKSAIYIRAREARAAFVATNSVCQGYSVAALWPEVIKKDLEISFAHKDFKWRNNASSNAAVICSIIGLRNRESGPKRLFAENTELTAPNINCYLSNGPNVYVFSTRESMFNLPTMVYGNKPVEGGHLLLTCEERETLVAQEPRLSRFLRPFMGSKEVVNGYQRYCIWIERDEVEEAKSIPLIRERIELVSDFRRGSTDKYVREKLQPVPWRFKQVFVSNNHAILVPSVSSENRPYLPVERVGAEVIVSNLNFALYDAPEWCIALIASRLHLVWIGTVCGKLKSDFRYSNTLGWNTFPVPNFTEKQLADLSDSARQILRTRYRHHPKTIADLYDPKEMPEDLRAVHRKNDELLESMYIGRPFRNDTERLEKLFKLYAARVEKLNSEKERGGA